MKTDVYRACDMRSGQGTELTAWMGDVNLVDS